MCPIYRRTCGQNCSGKLSTSKKPTRGRGETNMPQIKTGDRVKKAIEKFKERMATNECEDYKYVAACAAMDLYAVLKKVPQKKTKGE